MNHSNLNAAKYAKNDEFYTQYEDIQEELEKYYEYDKDFLKDKTVLCPCDDPAWSNFPIYLMDSADRYGIKRIISTSFDLSSDLNSSQPYDSRWGMISNGRILLWENSGESCGPLKGNGDFRSAEISKLRDEADIIITNPPFSLFREFLSWIREAGKKFLIIGNMNAINYKEVFPLIKDNKIWIGATGIVSRSYFNPKTDELQKFGNTCWFTNIEHGLRNKPLELNSYEFNEKNNKKVKALGGYRKYYNYDALEVPETKAIPNDYNGVMGVPISFLDKYCPEQFKIIGLTCNRDTMANAPQFGEEFIATYKKQGNTGHFSPGMYGVGFFDSNGHAKIPYGRILIQKI